MKNLKFIIIMFKTIRSDLPGSSSIRTNYLFEKNNNYNYNNNNYYNMVILHYIIYYNIIIK